MYIHPVPSRSHAQTGGMGVNAFSMWKCYATFCSQPAHPETMSNGSGNEQWLRACPKTGQGKYGQLPNFQMRARCHSLLHPTSTKKRVMLLLRCRFSCSNKIRKW